MRRARSLAAEVTAFKAVGEEAQEDSVEMDEVGRDRASLLMALRMRPSMHLRGRRTRGSRVRTIGVEEGIRAGSDIILMADVVVKLSDVGRGGGDEMR